MENVRFQIAAMCFLFVITLMFAKSRKLPLLSTRLFTAILAAVWFNLFCDVATVYTITHLNELPPFVNRFAHQLFIGSLNVVMFLIFLYVKTLGGHQKRLRLWEAPICALPLFVSLFIVAVGPLYYHVEGSRVYSYGPMANAVYGCIAIYLGLILLEAVLKRQTLTAVTRRSVFFGMLLWIFAAVIQLMFPFLLLSGLSSVLMIFFLYMAFANPRENVIANTPTFNSHAFDSMLSERIQSNRKFHLLIIVFEDMSTFHSRFGQTEAVKALHALSAYISEHMNAFVFLPRGNTLAVFMPKSPQRAQKKVQKLLDSFGFKWRVNDLDVEMRLKFGLLECPRYAKTIDEVYGTLYFFAKRSKTLHRGQCVMIDEEFLSDQKRYAAIGNILRSALENDGFNVFYQPIFSVSKNRFTCAEALVRLKDDKTLGFISPEEFIPIAEQQAVIRELGAVVFEKVCRFYSENELEKKGIEYIEVNLSGVQCMDSTLSESLSEIMKRSGVKPRCINLEITETVAIDSSYTVEDNIGKLKKIGCTFSMDDYGSGYSNLSHIAEFDFELIKLDKSLVWAFFSDDSPNGRIILSNTVRMINELGMGIVAEGVETEEQSKTLGQMGVEYMQGYYYSRPIPGEKLLELILPTELAPEPLPQEASSETSQETLQETLGQPASPQPVIELPAASELA